MKKKATMVFLAVVMIMISSSGLIFFENVTTADGTPPDVIKKWYQTPRGKWWCDWPEHDCFRFSQPPIHGY